MQLIGLMKSGFLLLCFNVSDPNLAGLNTGGGGGGGGGWERGISPEAI